MTTEDSFHDVVGALDAGDSMAAAAIFNRFASQLITVARGRLSDRLRQKVDPEDVVQSVFKSFFVRQADGQFTLENWNSMWGLLVRITMRKCNRWSERFNADRRSLANETSPVETSDSRAGWEAVSREPSPSEAMVLAETIDKLLDGLEAGEREMVALRLQGHTVPEISDKVQRSQRSVERILERVRKRLERMQEADDE